ncbi:hypothetical protein CANINC_003846 [Pichia inconspicua]|uniref:Uncharacterized protein n=1 Tax=Pichia inconspicua TaxID=52247 RepID=A0A4V4NFB7_9ASCO|nr:hypothetical protein CANINC_003846 [[Candida] inconspicua]
MTQEVFVANKLQTCRTTFKSEIQVVFAGPPMPNSNSRVTVRFTINDLNYGLNLSGIWDRPERGWCVPVDRPGGWEMRLVSLLKIPYFDDDDAVVDDDY